MRKDFVGFWNTEMPSGQPIVHPKDREWMECHWPNALRSPLYNSWEEYAASDRFGSDDKALHLSLIPTPYMGNLRDAKVLLFIGNPGFSDADYYFEDQTGIRERLIRNLHQKPNGDFPFFFLDPHLAWAGGFRWWQKILRPLIAELVPRCGTRIQAMKFLSQSIAAIELFPYHSMDGSELKGVNGKSLMPSVAEARNFFAHSSHNPEQLTVLLRAHKKWTNQGSLGLPDHYHHGPIQQTISLDPKDLTGGKVLAWLKR